MEKKQNGRIVDNFMTENQIDWAHCVGVCTDGGRSISFDLAY
jgi:hypothetical protein